MKPLGPRLNRMRELANKSDAASIREAMSLEVELKGEIAAAKSTAPPDLLAQLEGFERTLSSVAADLAIGKGFLTAPAANFGGIPQLPSQGKSVQVGIAGLTFHYAQKEQWKPSEVKVSFTDAVLREIFDKNKVSAGGAEVAAFVRPHVREHVLGFNYDSQVFALEFLDELNKKRATNPNASAAEVFLSHNPRSAELLDREGGSHCVGLSLDLVKRLKEAGLPAEVGAAEIPGSAARFGHAFAFVPFKNPDDAKDRGIVIMDPGLNLPEPIVVRPDEPGRLVLGEGDKKQTWTFTLDEETGKISVKRELKKGVEESQWIAVAWDNPDEVLSYLSSSSQKLKQVSRDENGDILAATNLDFKRRQLTIRVGDEQTRIPFEDVEKTLPSAVSEELATLLGFSGTAPLIERLTRLVDAENDLRETQDLVKKSAEERA